METDPATPVVDIRVNSGRLNCCGLLSCLNRSRLLSGALGVEADGGPSNGAVCVAGAGSLDLRCPSPSGW